MYSISFTREMNRVPKAIHYRNLSEPWHITQKHIPLQLWLESEHLYAARRSKETFLVGLSLFPLFINPFIMIYMFNYIHQQSLKAGLILSFISSIVHIQMAEHFYRISLLIELPISLFRAYIWFLPLDITLFCLYHLLVWYAPNK